MSFEQIIFPISKKINITVRAPKQRNLYTMLTQSHLEPIFLAAAQCNTFLYLTKSLPYCTGLITWIQVASKGQLVERKKNVNILKQSRSPGGWLNYLILYAYCSSNIYFSLNFSKLFSPTLNINSQYQNIVHNEKTWKLDYIHFTRIPRGCIIGRNHGSSGYAQGCVCYVAPLPVPWVPYLSISFLSFLRSHPPIHKGERSYPCPYSCLLCLWPKRACTYVPSFSSPPLCRLCWKGVPISFNRAPCSLISLGTSYQLPTSSPLLLLSNP